MAMIRVQFQRGLSMAEFMQRYGSEAQFETALTSSRWPQGFACPVCRCHLYTTFERAGRTHWQCRRCRHQTTATAGTVFASTKLLAGLSLPSHSAITLMSTPDCSKCIAVV